MADFDRVADLLEAAARDRAFPGAAIEVGRQGAMLWRHSVGRLRETADAAPVTEDTVYDLASLTKVIATTTLAVEHVDRGGVRLDDRVSRWLSGWAGPDRREVTVRDLLAHCSGVPAHRPLFHDHRGRHDFEDAICRLPLEYAPRSRSLYSDLGFVLLGFILEDAAGERLDAQFDAWTSRAGLSELRFRPPHGWRPRTAATGASEWRGRALLGEVHDDNAWALGGVAGHAGLFGTAAAVGRFAQTILTTLERQTAGLSPATLRAFLTRAPVPGSSRALGWDTMLPTSSCGRRMSPSAVGHTGFTGTSLWVDPAADLYVVLLSNRVEPTAANEAIQTVRPQVHDAVVEALE